jgi:hypothetical protein
MKKHVSFWIGIGILNLLLGNLSSVARTSTVQGKGNAGPAKSAEEACQAAEAIAESNAEGLCSQTGSDSEVVNESLQDTLSGDARVGFRCSSTALVICNALYTGPWDG